jgi:hypothetical protein
MKEVCSILEVALIGVDLLETPNAKAANHFILTLRYEGMGSKVD